MVSEDLEDESRPIALTFRPLMSMAVVFNGKPFAARKGIPFTFSVDTVESAFSLLDQVKPFLDSKKLEIVSVSA